MIMMIRLLPMDAFAIMFCLIHYLTIRSRRKGNLFQPLKSFLPVS